MPELREVLTAHMRDFHQPAYEVRPTPTHIPCSSNVASIIITLPRPCTATLGQDWAVVPTTGSTDALTKCFQLFKPGMYTHTHATRTHICPPPAHTLIIHFPYQITQSRQRSPSSSPRPWCGPPPSPSPPPWGTTSAGWTWTRTGSCPGRWRRRARSWRRRGSEYCGVLKRHHGEMGV